MERVNIATPRDDAILRLRKSEKGKSQCDPVIPFLHRFLKNGARAISRNSSNLGNVFGTVSKLSARETINHASWTVRDHVPT
jgi:hypothetical protein